MFEYKILRRDNKTHARIGVLTTPHGRLHTPELAIVATDGEIKSIPPDYLSRLPLQYAIVNTFHIYTKNILAKIEAANGIHTYGNFKCALASDSGGFQVFSLGFGKAHGVGKVANIFPEEITNYKLPIMNINGTIRQSDLNNPISITDEGVSFPFDNRTIVLNPEISMDIQHRIGADIIFAFDECTSPLNSKKYTSEALLRRTQPWLLRCIAAHHDFKHKQALFAIVQGGAYENLRKEAARFVAQQDVPGFGIGGSLGSTKQDMYNILEWTLPLLPDEKPRHLLGIGQVRDIFAAVERGIDLFDCVIPTREARHKVIDKECACQACQDKITWQQLAQLFSLRDPRAYFYATVHNIQFFADLMKQIRSSIESNSFSDLKTEYFQYYP